MDPSLRCSPDVLPQACLEEGIGNLVSELLEQSCQLCLGIRDPRLDTAGRISDPGPFDPQWGSGVCVDVSQPGAEELADLALKLLPGRFLQRCPVAHWAAYLITLQYAISTRPLDVEPTLQLLQPVLDDSGPRFDLFPFPFWSETRSLADQIHFHSNFMSGTVLVCDGDKTLEFRGRAVLRAAHDREETHCAAHISDGQLVRRCREQKRRQLFPGMRGFSTQALDVVAAVPQHPSAEEWFSQMRCPTAAEEDAFFATRPSDWRERSQAALEKYGMRSQGSRQTAGLGCEEPSSEWAKDLRPLHKCVFVVIMERLQLPPGARVLDWGTGCGHKLTWGAQLYDLHGVGLDIVPENIRWARENSVGQFCQMDGRFLDWIPNDTFDAVISYAALMHLVAEDQCNTVLTLVEKVHVGGRLWFGWNAPMIRSLEALMEMPESDPEFWHDCFAAASAQKELWSTGEVSIQWETVTESNLFPADSRFHDSYLFWEPAYSLFITRVPP